MADGMVWYGDRYMLQSTFDHLSRFFSTLDRYVWDNFRDSGEVIDNTIFIGDNVVVPGSDERGQFSATDLEWLEQAKGGVIITIHKVRITIEYQHNRTILGNLRSAAERRERLAIEQADREANDVPPPDAELMRPMGDN